MYKIIEKSDKYLTQKSKSEKTEIKSEELKEEINNHEELVENIEKGKDFIKMNGQYEIGKMLFLLFVDFTIYCSKQPIGQHGIYQNDVNMKVLKNQITTLVDSKVIIKIICFICSFITEKEEIQEIVSSIHLKKNINRY
ncbi:hypothetical protein EDI_303350 [Entamoeba dispar SAW760]|uniref:Uncharacterized protein n=1 Tax=Entamoeba dispar (strain ATCC PRA-260 / SAW760) TaxID=370354 RepID=B0ECK3_ENTDS|nr:uncharacterized protein EDI_303350 [Entamoeba dispar SAW760]EDR27743.1 hypothetical protein EDI_303350 [Entamoeba dispar SAW760]|eukprot:EDR27743.1 hypothetical protein EDI_303350 [Entamoeba dispar SAW760]